MKTLPEGKFILIGVTGGIAAYKTADVISQLKEKAYPVVVVMTEEAKQFITPLTLQTISGNPVFSNLFTLPSREWNAVHIALARQARLVAVIPATANVIGKLANGICDDLLTCVITATEAPVLLAPAMNTQMYQHPAIQGNLKKLRGFGYHFVDPEKGRLACGTEGIGHVASVEKVIRAIKKVLT
ncbi:MAG: hypothetical protein HYS56_00120 [Candidatus Omnitrophica bacterium]|nr:hypothetical protein [Candidatus Omnitrophota bacterium]